MRARLIYEKFEEQSDPIRDMEIGGAEIDIKKEMKFIQHQANVRKLTFFKKLYGKTIEGYFAKNGELGMWKFKLKKVSEGKIILNTYYFVDEEGNEYRLDSDKIKVWG